MLYFENDYSEGAHEDVLKRLIETNMEQLPGYGTDRYTLSAKEKICAACGCPDAEVYLLTGGTQTNQIVISSMLDSHEGVIAAETGHVGTHEAGAIEWTGHKVLTLPQADGKIPAADQEETEDPTPGDRAPVSSEEISSVTPEGRISECPRAKKIQRSDISSLPRRFWFLANNSFLLHGYHNYNHLLLVEEDDRMWLGVPGIYDPREARAAELFGFPQFTRAYIRELDLSEEERNDDADFGHWCRYLDQAK